MKEPPVIDRAAKTRFEEVAHAGVAMAAPLAARARSGDQGAGADLAALLFRAGFIDPERIREIYDEAAAGWLDGRTEGAATSGLGLFPVSATLWADFWDFIEDTRPTDAGAFTMRAAALGSHTDSGFLDRAISASAAFDGVLEAAANGWPEKFGLDELAACPTGSLGHDFHRLIVDNAFDLEVLDRDALGLSQLPAPLDYLNARALQCHDLWHIVAGYRTTALHEVAISAFQLSMFGHNYSAQFLAVVATKAAFGPPGGLHVMLETILTAWRHGRASPSLLGVDWKDLWSYPAEEVRSRLGVRAYPSPFPADLFEQMRNAA
jgi:ubiquinone biosynthesis protein Coq4